jgi:hypothetical protein
MILRLTASAIGFLPGGLVHPLTNPQKDKRVKLYSRHRNILSLLRTKTSPGAA